MATYDFNGSCNSMPAISIRRQTKLVNKIPPKFKCYGYDELDSIQRVSAWKQ